MLGRPAVAGRRCGRCSLQCCGPGGRISGVGFCGRATVTTATAEAALHILLIEDYKGTHHNAPVVVLQLCMR